MTISVVADVHQRLNWPQKLIEVETDGYAFDVAAYDALMSVRVETLEAQRVGGKAPRYYVLATCPRCGGPTVIEVNEPNAQAREVAAIPDMATSTHVMHLPEDVMGYYTDARRVLDAGVPDAAAVQLRRTSTERSRRGTVARP